MVSHHPAKFGGHKYCNREQNSTCCGLNPPLMFISQGHGLTAYGLSY